MKLADMNTVTHKVGTCPACRCYLWAEVDLSTLVSAPTLTEDGQAHAVVNVKPIAMRIAHECGPEADESRGSGYCAADPGSECGLGDECPPFYCREVNPARPTTPEEAAR